MILSTGTYTRRRYAVASIDPATGRAAATATTDTDFTANVQPLTGEALQNLEEGQRARKPMLVMTMTELATLDAATNRPPDAVVIDSVEFEVIAVERYTVHLPHYEAIVVRRAVPT